MINPQEMQQSQGQGPKPSIISDTLMDAVRWKESRGDPNAENKESKASGHYQFMPNTTKWLSDKYGDFDPKNPAQSRAMSKRYLEDLVKSTGSVEKALAAYGGHITKDPTEYVSSILGKQKEYEFDNKRRLILADTGGSSQNILNLMREQNQPPGQPQGQAQGQAQAQQVSAPQAQGQAPAAQGQAPAAQGQAPEQAAPLTGSQNIRELMKSPDKATSATPAPGQETPAAPTTTTAPAKPAPPPQAALPTTVGQTLKEGASINRSMNEAFEGAKGTVAYWTQRITGKSAEESSKGAANTSLTSELYKLVMGKELKQGDKPDTNFDRQMNFLGEHIGEGAAWLAEKTGIPKSDIEQAMTALGTIAGGKAPIKAVGGAVKTAAVKAIPESVKQATTATIDAINKVNPITGKVNFEKIPRVERPPITESYTPKETGGYAEKKLPKDQQVERAQVLIRTGSTDSNTAVLTGDGPTRSTQWTMAQTDSELGKHFKDIFNKEFAETNSFSKQLITDVGGTHGMNQSALIARGRNIRNPIKDLDDYMEKEISRVYTLRDTDAGGVPVRLEKTLELLNDPAWNALNPETAGLAGTIKAWMIKKGAMDSKGNLLDSTGLTAESIRKVVNANKDHKTSALWNELRQSLDDDVFAYAGKALYKDARALFTLRKNTLDNPKGISNLLVEEGVNRKVYDHNVAKNVIGLPYEQLEQIVNTLRTQFPDHLKPKAEKAIAEMKSQYLNEINELGNSGTGGNVKSWNAKKVTAFLKNSDEDMKLLFTPEERAKIADLNDRGQLLHTDTGYKGAGVQGFNLGEQGLVSKGANTAVMIASESMFPTFGVVGSFLKGGLDKRAGRKAQEKRVKEEQKKTIQLKDIGGK